MLAPSTEHCPVTTSTWNNNMMDSWLLGRTRLSISTCQLESTVLSDQIVNCPYFILARLQSSAILACCTSTTRRVNQNSKSQQLCQ